MVKHTKSTQGSIKKVQIEHIIGDYKEFFTDLQKQLQQIPIDIREYPLSHLNYRVATQEEYRTKRDQLKMFCSEFVETPLTGALLLSVS
jgi:predicted metalloenzyme YecM